MTRHGNSSNAVGGDATFRMVARQNIKPMLHEQHLVHRNQPTPRLADWRCFHPAGTYARCRATRIELDVLRFEFHSKGSITCELSNTKPFPPALLEQTKEVVNDHSDDEQLKRLSVSPTPRC